MSRGAVFLDRDDTIAKDVGYCSKVEDFALLPFVPEAIKLLNDNGFKVIVITNQSGIARGLFTEEILAQIHQHMQQELARFGARLDAIYYCPHHPDDGCQCRKPGTALFHEAAEKFDIDFYQSFMVGDTYMDIEAGKALGCKSILVTTGSVKGENYDGKVQPDFIADSLFQAARWIISSASNCTCCSEMKAAGVRK